MSKIPIRIAHSPDSDDAFMFYALQNGHVKSDQYEFIIERRDIEELNKLALKEHYDITAISMHAYAHVHDRYALTASACSMAENNYGPMVVSKTALNPKDLSGKTIAVPGEWTTAFLLLKMMIPDFKHKVIPFDHIIMAVEEDLVDAGLLIHEGQLQYKEHGLTKILSVMDYWKSVAGTLPLPLGGSAIKRSLGHTTLQELARIQKESIAYALKNPEAARDYAMQFKRDLNTEEADLYLSWYANQRTLDLGQEGRHALALLFKLAEDQHLIPSNVPLDIID